MAGRILRVLCLFLGLAGLGLTIWKYLDYNVGRINTEDELLALSKSSVLKMALGINSRVSRIVDATRLMSNDFTEDLVAGNLSTTKVEARIRLEARQNPDIQAIGIATEPGILAENQGLYAPYYVRNAQGEFEMVRIDQKFDYFKLQNDEQGWYGKFAGLQGSWAEPTKDVQTGELQLVYALPFERFDRLTLRRVPAGVVFIAMAQDTFQQMIKELDLGDEGYAFMISAEGKYLAHPDPQLINLSMAEYANNNQFDDPELINDVKKAVNQEIYIRPNGISGNRPCWFFYEPIPQASWSLGIVLQKDPDSDVLRAQKYEMVKIALLLLAAVILLGMFFFQLQPNFMTGIWMTAIFSSLCIVGIIAFIWYLEIDKPTGVESEKTPLDQAVLVNRAVLNKRIAEVDQAFSLEDLEPPKRIPTGIFIESVSVDGRDITLSGYLWQKYPPALAPEVGTQAVVFSTSQDDSLAESYRFIENDIVTVGYYFRVTQQQTFASERYPLDQETVAFQMQPAQIDHNYLLVPDLDAYSTTNPSGLPGLKPGVLLTNWKILASSFTYTNDQRNADFGSNKNIKIHDLPALTFNLTLARSIVPSMLSYGITAMVIAILMFSLVVSKADSLRDVLTESFALFFVLVVAHVGLRGELAAQGVVYLETVFIILYGLILIGVLNGILEFTSIKIPILSYREGLLFKLFYWPILFGSFLLISLKLFYPGLFQ